MEAGTQRVAFLRMSSHHEHEHGHEPNLYKTHVRRCLAEYPYPLLTRDQLSSAFTPEEIAEALAAAYALQAPRRPWRDVDGGETEIVIYSRTALPGE